MTTQNKERVRLPSVGETGVLALLLLLASGLRLYGLDAQLWIDEVSALTGSIRRPALEILTTWPGASSHVLYELLAHGAWWALGEGPVSIRLPAALFGVAGIWAMHRFVRVFLPAHYALGAAALLTFSYIHIFQSQNARGYTALIFFFLLASAELVRFSRTGEVTRRGGAIYMSAGVLAGYSQIFGVVILPAHIAIATAWWAVESWREASRGTQTRFPLKEFLPWGFGGVILTGLAYLPFVRSVLRFATERAGMPGEGPGLGWGLVAETLEGLTAALGGPVPLAVGLALGAVGALVWWHRDAFSLLVVLSPIVLQLGVFAILGAGVHPRYFAVALPGVYVVGTLGLFALTKTAGRWAFDSEARARTAAVVTVALIVVLSALPLPDYYRFPKQDFLGAMQFVERQAAPEDVVVGVTSTGRVLAEFYQYDVITVDELQELKAVEEGGGAVWVMTSLEGLLEAAVPELFRHVRDRYERVAFFPGTVGDGAVRVYRRELPGNE